MPQKPSELVLKKVLLAAKHPKTKRAMQNLKKACDYLDHHKIQITVTEAGKVTEDASGGPKTPSIRNQKHFLDYIRARRAEQKLPAPANSPRNASVRTGEPVADAYIYGLEAQLRIARERLASLRSSLLHAGEFDLEATLETGKLVPAHSPREPRAAGNQELAGILSKILDPARLESLGLMLSGGRICSRDHPANVFLEKPEIECLVNEIDRRRAVLRQA
jgi:hypothetical protein